MGLTLKKLILQNFRSYEDYDLEPHEELSVLVGPNAAGKTNIIEAVQLLTTTESFRNPAWSDVVRQGQDSCLLVARASGESRDLEISLEVERDGSRTFRVNGKVRRRRMEVMGILPSVIFTPDDLRMVKDAAEARRRSLDEVGAQMSPSYRSLKREYERVVRQRNALLRDESLSRDQQESWDEALVATGARFTDARMRLFSRLGQALIEEHSHITPGSQLVPQYVPCWEREGEAHAGDSRSEDELRELLSKKRGEERARRTTLVGPHRDEMVFLLNGSDARAFGSQGQQRTIALAWKLAQVRVITEVLGQRPLLLLDDVMSELDETRRHALTDRVGRAAQTIITTTNTNYFDEEMLDRALVVDLK